MATKTLILGAAILTSALPVLAQPAQRVEQPGDADGVYRVIEMGPHSRTWRRIHQVQGPDGFLQRQTNSYVELATGMSRWNPTEQKWSLADDEVEVLVNHAVARKSAHQVTFSNNANDPQGTIELTTPDGKRLKSRVVGLAYTESDTGKSVWIAETRDAPGFVVGRNQVLYVDAFDHVNADIRYVTTRASFEADVILRERLPNPADYGLKPETTKLEVWTEFLNPPEPVQQIIPRRRKTGQEVADMTLGFGAMRIGPGRAFSLGAQLPQDPLERERTAIPVFKEWQPIDGKTFLIEAVFYLDARAQIDALPQAQAHVDLNPDQKERLMARRDTRGRTRPISFVQQTPASVPAPARQFARIDSLPQKPGYVLDWESLSSETDFTFRGDRTYFAEDTVNLSGTTTLEGGAVTKFAKWDSGNWLRMRVLGPFVNRTSPYRPAIFTAMDDNSIGDLIEGSTGSPTNTYAYGALYFENAAASTVEHAKFLYCQMGCYFDTAESGSTVRHSQFVKCYAPIMSRSDVSLQNCLFYDSVTAIRAEDATISVENVTVNVAGYAPYNDGNAAFYLTNCLMINVTNAGSYSGQNNSAATGSGIFQTIGGGAHYLAANSLYRNAGTTSVNAELLADLRKRTTYPPAVITNNVTDPTTLAPTVARDTDAPDLGYHYPVADFALDCSIDAEASVTVEPGTVLLSFGGVGIRPSADSSLTLRGTATSPIIFARYENVQEQPTLWGESSAYYYLILPNYSSSGGSTALLTFTEFHAIGANRRAIWSDASPNYNFTDLSVSDCQFFGGASKFDGASTSTHVLRNNLFFGNILYFISAATLQCYNNLFYKITGSFFQSGSQSWTFTDNAFDQFTYEGSSITNLTHGYNAYINCGSHRIGSSPNNDVIITNAFTYASGSLGDFYLGSSGSSLTNAGGRSAADASLYHHTTRVDQAKDSSAVDIGFHYVALNDSDLPIDTDGDGLPDYLEDRDGDSTLDTGETYWLDPFNDVFKVRITEPKNNSNLP